MPFPPPLLSLEKKGRSGLRAGAVELLVSDELERSSSEGVREEIEELVDTRAGIRTTWESSEERLTKFSNLLAKLFFSFCSPGTNVDSGCGLLFVCPVFPPELVVAVLWSAPELIADA